MKKSKFIEIIKKLIEREGKLKEASTSSATPGYMTPHAFSGKGKKDRRDSIASGSGYEKVNEAKFAVTIDLGKELGGEAKVIVDAGSKGAAITMVAKNLRQGRSAVKGAVKVNPALGKKVDTVGETIHEQSKVIKSISNLAKKNKYGTVTGTQMNGKTANTIMKIYNHPKMKRRQKDLDNLTSDELANLTIDRDVIRILGLNEGKYHDYRNDESLTPRQKIGHSMREVRNALRELNKLIEMNVRLKNELNVDSRSYWKNTHKALGKISERLVKLANKVGKLQWKL